MEHKTNKTLRYVISLTQDLYQDDVSSAILMLLLELGFRTSADGFWYLREAILMRCNNPDTRVSAIYDEIVRTSKSQVTKGQVEQAILTLIKTAWASRDKEQWDLFFSEEKMRSSGRPSNKEFISEIGCIMELWRSCRKEGCYGIK